MELLLYKILFAYFGIGAVVTQVINRDKLMTIRRKNWLKYFTYLILVNIVFASILVQPNFFVYVAGIIITFGFLELIKNTRHHSKISQSTFFVLIFLFFAYFFFQFSRMNVSYLFYTYFLVTVFDGFSQLSGQLLGKTKLLPTISPNKTIEGLIGGILITTLTSIFIRNILEFSKIQSVIFGLGVSLFSFLGDILASYGKRKLGIKDYSKWIPGHGGFLDRFDSFILAGFFVYTLTKVIAL